MSKATCSSWVPSPHLAWFVPVTLGWSGPGVDSPLWEAAGAWPASSRGRDVTHVSPLPGSPSMLSLSHYRCIHLTVA